LAKNISIGIDIGNSQLKVVLLRKTSQGVKIDKYFIEDYKTSPKDLESPEVRRNKILEILSRIFKEIKPANVVLTVAKGEDNVRAISMPLMQEKALREALKWGGLPDYIPFDLKDMVWDVNISQLFRRKEEIKVDGKEKMDVILAISKREVVNKYLDIVENMKFSIDVLDSNTLASINFSCFNSVVSKEKVWSKIDFGAESTSINILEGNNLKLNLNVPWGVNDIIEATQTVLGKTWEESVEFVKGIDFSKEVSLQEEPVQRVFKAIESKMKDFLRQLNSTFNFFESKNPNKVVSSLLLSGGGSKLLGIDKYLMNMIGKEVYVEKINKNLISFNKKEEEKLNSLICFLDVAIGAALRNLVSVKNNINLLPLEVIIGRRLRSRRLSTVAVAIIIFLMLSSVSIYKFNMRDKVVKDIEKLQLQLSEISGEANELYKMKQAIDAFKEVEKEYTYIKRNTTSWNSVVYELVSSIVPSDIYLDRASWEARGFTTDGKCPKKNDQVKLFIDNAEQSKYFKGLLPGNVVISGDEIKFSASKRAKTR